MRQLGRRQGTGQVCQVVEFKLSLEGDYGGKSLKGAGIYWVREVWTLPG